jgi:hypothetical protein
MLTMSSGGFLWNLCADCISVGSSGERSWPSVDVDMYVHHVDLAVGEQPVGVGKVLSQLIASHVKRIGVKQG